MNAPVQPPLTVEEALERAIRATADLQSTMHQAGDSNAYTVFTMVTMLKDLRSPETVEKLESERLQRARG
jgi:hypothetical protein